MPNRLKRNTLRSLLSGLLGWPAAHFQITITTRTGEDLDQTAALHTLMRQIGRMTVGETFGSFSCNFQNLTFCGSARGAVRGDYWYYWPVCDGESV